MAVNGWNTSVNLGVGADEIFVSVDQFPMLVIAQWSSSHPATEV